MLKLSMDFISCTECDKPARTGGLCPAHYSAQLRGGSERESDNSPMPGCAVWHCDRDANSRSDGALCQPHYQLKYRGIDPASRIIRKNPTSDHANDKKCAVRDCPRRAQTKGCCKKHYDQVATGRIPSPEGVDIPLRPKCDFPDCRNLQFSLKKGLCKSHIYQLLQGRELSPLRDYGVYESGQKKCSIRDCKNFATGRTMCQKHLSRANQYGLTAAELDDLLAIAECQNPGCSETKNLHIDHDHDTGKVRGLLCSSCNTTLGHMKENVERIRGLAEYKLMHS